MVWGIQCQETNACKFIVDNRYKNLSYVEKELIKEAIDKSVTVEQMLVTALTAIAINSK